MKRFTAITLTILLATNCLIACGNKEEEGIQKIEANNTTESGEKADTKYKDGTNENAIAPDSSSTTDGQQETQTDENAVIDREPSIYGVWYSNDNKNLTIYNSPAGVKFSMYEPSIDVYLTGDVDTDEKTYIEIKYLASLKENIEAEDENVDGPKVPPVEEEASEEIPTNTEDTTAAEDEALNPFGSDEELYKSIDAEQEALYETIRYNITKLEFDKEAATMYMTLANDNETIEFNSVITSSTPDYSLENNDLSQGMVEEVESEDSEDNGEEIIPE